MRIELDVKPLVDAVRGIADKQLPFAVALALTKTAQDAQAAVRGEMPKRFTLRNQFIVKGVRIEKATKTSFEATVYHKDDFMELQETGGVKRPTGQSKAIPIDVRQGARGVPPSQWPRALQANPNVFRARIGGVDGLWQRLGRRRAGRSLKLLYVLQPIVVVKPRFGFQDTVKRTAQARIAPNFTAAFERAVRTAR